MLIIGNPRNFVFCVCVFYLHLLALTPVYFQTSYHVQEDTQPRGISGAVCLKQKKISKL